MSREGVATTATPVRGGASGAARVTSPARQKTRLRILKGAAAVFAERGVSATTVEDILAAAGVSRRTYYQFFADKLDVLAAIHRRSVEHLLEQQQRAVAEGSSGVDCLLRGQNVYLKFVARSGSVVQALATEALRRDSPLAESRRWLHEQLVALYGAAWQRHEGRELAPLLLMSIILLVESVSIYALVDEGGTATAVDEARRTLEHSVRRMVDAAG